LKREAPGLYWVESEALTAILFISCKQDVAVKRELHQRLTSLPKSEQAAWVLDSEINDRGVRIDVPLAIAAAKLVAQALVELHARVCHETGGAVPAATQVKKLKEWLRQQGIVLPRRLKKSKEGPRLEHCLPCGLHARQARRQNYARQ
jgi:hypothetical protein